jgi:poly-beta-hydroxybutyrate-responsive repressor
VAPPLTRFVEPAALLALRDGASHGYELADEIAAMLGLARVDYGNLYRLLRRLEHEGLVSSTWLAATEGRSRRSYELSADGRQLLDAWMAAFEGTRDRIESVLERYHDGTGR